MLPNFRERISFQSYSTSELAAMFLLSSPVTIRHGDQIRPPGSMMVLLRKIWFITWQPLLLGIVNYIIVINKY